MTKTDRVIQEPASRQEEPSGTREDDDLSVADEVGEPLDEAVAMDEVATFDGFTVWGHEALPDQKDNPFVRGLAEWVKFADAVCLELVCSIELMLTSA